MDVSKRNIEELYDDFSKEKSELESTLATIEILSDKKALNDIDKVYQK